MGKVIVVKFLLENNELNMHLHCGSQKFYVGLPKEADSTKNEISALRFDYSNMAGVDSVFC